MGCGSSSRRSSRRSCPHGRRTSSSWTLRLHAEPLRDARRRARRLCRRRPDRSRCGPRACRSLRRRCRTRCRSRTSADRSRAPSSARAPRRCRSRRRGRASRRRSTPAITAGFAFSTVTVQLSPPSVSIALPPAPSGRTTTPPFARSLTSLRLPMISTVTSGTPSSVNVNRVEYRMRSLSLAEVSSARAATATRRARATMPARNMHEARHPPTVGARNRLPRP